MEPYLQRLTGKLIDGVDQLPVTFRKKHADWVASRQNPDGGFSGREGGSDLYYTGFALRTLAVLQHLNPPICERAAVYLRSQLAGSATVIDFFSFLVGAFLVRIAGGPDVLAGADAHWPDHVAIALETHRNSDGGYSRSPGGSSGSTYTTFIVALALELLGKQVPDVTNATRFVEARRRGGGFVEIPQMKRAGTNPTAAGFGSLQILGAIDNVSIDLRREVVDFLVGMRSSSEGGLRANDRIPTADLLSTFTGCWTIAEAGGVDRLNVAELNGYANATEEPEGGFRGGIWDTQGDVEYTFYGVGLRGLLTLQTPQR